MSEPGPVICNAGPLIALGKLNRLDLLANLYAEVQIPEAVYNEVVHQGAMRGEPDARVVRLFWQQKRWPVVLLSDEALAQVPTLSSELGRGETAVLALGLLSTNSTLLMDDAVARREARRMELNVYGTLGILVQGYQGQYLSLSEVEFLILEVAARSDIWISDLLCRQVLAHLHNSVESK